jgi:hypothetical protein
MKERPETIENLLKGYLEANAFILNPANGEIVKKSIVKNLGDKMGDGSVAYKQIVALFVKAKPYSNRKGVQLIIDEVKNLNPEAATLKVDDFVDDSVLQKLDKSGFIDSLYKGRKIPK